MIWKNDHVSYLSINIVFEDKNPNYEYNTNSQTFLQASKYTTRNPKMDGIHLQSLWWSNYRLYTSKAIFFIFIVLMRFFNLLDLFEPFNETTIWNEGEACNNTHLNCEFDENYSCLLPTIFSSIDRLNMELLLNHIYLRGNLWGNFEIRIKKLRPFSRKPIK